MACWAYYPGPGDIGRRPEPLGWHLVCVAMGVRAHKDFNRLVGKITREYNLDANLVSDFITLAGGLHDIGKALAKYQEKPAEGFSGHEVYSTFIINHVLYINSIDYDSPIGRLLAYPVLLHHYAQRGSLRDIYNKVLKDIYNKASRDRKTRERVWQDCIKDLDWAFSRIREFLTTDTGLRIIKSLLGGVRGGELSLFAVGGDFIGGLGSIVNTRDWFGVMAVAGLLNEVDGKIAGDARGGEE